MPADDDGVEVVGDVLCGVGLLEDLVARALVGDQGCGRAAQVGGEGVGARLGRRGLRSSF